MKQLAKHLILSAAALCLSLPALGDVPAPGYSVQSAPNPAFAAPFTTLPSGDFVTFDGLAVERWDALGVHVQTLGTLPSGAWPSFAISDPTGSLVVVGETTNHNVWIVPSTGAGMTPLAALTFNFDAAFSPTAELYVSAAAGGFGQGNDIYRVAIPSGALQLVAHVPGPSGPIAFDAAGNLYYATQYPGFPAPAGSTDVIRWSAAQVAAGALTELDATIVCTGLDGASSLAVDPTTQRLYVGEVSFLLGTSLIRRVGATQASSPVVCDAGNLSILGMQFLAGAGPATFDAFQPQGGVTLAYGATDFSGTSTRNRLSPKRPRLTLSGPGLTGPGTVTLTLEDGVPNGGAYLLHCAQSSLLPGEVPVAFPTFLLHTPFVLSQTRRVPFYMPADANGTTLFQIHNPGNMQGTRAFQVLVSGSSGTFFGSSNAAQF